MKIAIAGAGISGLTAAIALKQKGFDVTVYESVPELKPVGAGLSLSANAIQALERLNIKRAVLAEGNFLQAFKILDQKGKPITTTLSEDIRKVFGDDNFSIHRAALHKVLCSFLQPHELVLSKRIIDVETISRGVLLQFSDGTTAEASCLVAADGIHSAVRKKFVPDTLPRYAGYTCWRGIVHHSSIKPDGASETWGAQGRFGIVPLTGNDIYWFACVNAKSNDPQKKKYTIYQLREQFKFYHSPIDEILAETKPESIVWNDIIDLKPIHRYAYGKVVLMGDAAHASTPNMGQGACQGIEDAVVLADELSKSDSVEAAFKAYESRRINRTHYVVNTSARIGQLAQLQHPVLITMRNVLMRNMPSAVNLKQFKKLYEVDF